ASSKPGISKPLQPARSCGESAARSISELCLLTGASRSRRVSMARVDAGAAMIAVAIVRRYRRAFPACAYLVAHLALRPNRKNREGRVCGPFWSSGGGIRTRDLRVMSPTSYQTAPPRVGTDDFSSPSKGLARALAGEEFLAAAEQVV